MVYVRLGYDRTLVKVTEKGTLLGGDSTKAWANGVDFGMGIETAIARHLSLRGEYIYTRDSTFDTKFDTTFSPSNSEFTLGLLYHFNC